MGDSVFTFADEEERDVCTLLSDAATYGVERVDVIETHIGRVFLAGDSAYKLRKRVNFGFVDFSTLAARHAAAQRELELNRPHAPRMYHGLIPIVRRDGKLQLAAGEDVAGDVVVDWLVHMQRFPQEAVLSYKVLQGPLGDELAKALADMVARYHQDSAIATLCDGAGRMQAVVEQLADALQVNSPEIARGLRTAFEHVRSQLTERGDAGCVRRCHGDLHLGNIVLIDGQPVPFDALEFSEALGTIDVLYDLAFLLMDLEARGDHVAANAVFNAYFAFEPLGNEIEALTCLPLFLACRAGVRAIVAMARLNQVLESERAGVERVVDHYAAMVSGYLTPSRPLLIAVGGLSGTGKTTLAAMLASHVGPAPGALHVRSDVERKRLFGVPETQKLDRQHYRVATAQRVYGMLEDKARRGLRAGHAVIVDAVFAKPEERAMAAAVAADAGYQFVGLWLTAPEATLVARVEQRVGDASDADRRVVREQLRYEIGAMDWLQVDASGSMADSLQAGLRALAGAGVELRASN